MDDEFSGLWKLYDYYNEKGVNEIKLWTEKLEKKHRIKLNLKLDMLEQTGPDLSPRLLAGPVFDHVYKLRVDAKEVQLRPFLCKGPIDNGKEFTLLLGAKEVGGKYDPRNAKKIAAYNRMEIIANKNRRCDHERIR